MIHLYKLQAKDNKKAPFNQGCKKIEAVSKEKQPHVKNLLFRNYFTSSKSTSVTSSLPFLSFCCEEDAPAPVSAVGPPADEDAPA